MPTTDQQLKFSSRPYERRIALIPMKIAIGLAWVLVAFGFAAASFTMHSALGLGSIILLTVCALAVYMVYLTNRWIQEGKWRHELSINGKAITLTSFDQEQKTQMKQEISLADVVSAEYYPAQDVSSLLLQGRTNSLDIPLWCFGPEAEREIVNYLKSYGVNMTNIPAEPIMGKS